MVASSANRILPPAAASRLSHIETAAHTAEEAVNYAVGRIREIQNMLGLNPGMADADREQFNIEIKELTAQRNEAQARRNAARGLVGELDNFLLRLNREGRPIELAPKVATPKQKNGESLKTVLERVRQEIDAIKGEQYRTRLAPPPIEDLKAQARSYVQQMATSVQPRPTPAMARGEGFDLSWFGDDAVSQPLLTPKRGIALLCWLYPDKATERLVNVIAQMPRPAVPALSEEEKRAKLKELAATLDRLEREEEATVDALHRDGMINVARRVDASPLAILGIRYVVKSNGLAPVPRRPASNGNGVHHEPEPKRKKRGGLARVKPKNKEDRAARH